MKTHFATRHFPKSLLPAASALLLAAAALTAGSPRVEAQTLLNGSFEAPSVGTNASGGGTSWNPTGSVSIFNNANLTGTTTFGSQYLVLNSATATDAQTISSGFVNGTSYRLTLVASDYNGQAGGDVLTISVSGGATGSTPFTLPQRTTLGNNALPFITETFNFTATSSVTPITITLTDTSGGAIAVDNVQLVPEPSAVAALLGGLGLLLGVQRWRGGARREDAVVRA